MATMGGLPRAAGVSVAECASLICSAGVGVEICPAGCERDGIAALEGDGAAQFIPGGGIHQRGHNAEIKVDVEEDNADQPGGKTQPAARGWPLPGVLFPIDPLCGSRQQGGGRDSHLRGV